MISLGQLVKCWNEDDISNKLFLVIAHFDDFNSFKFLELESSTKAAIFSDQNV